MKYRPDSRVGEIVREVQQSIENEIYGHSRFQIENFIIGSQPTDYGKYKQCILELRSRIKNRDILIREIDKLETKKEKSDQDVAFTTLPAEECRKLAEHKIALENIDRELYILSDIFNKVKIKIDLSRRDELEIGYWNAKFEQELMYSWMIGGSITTNLVQSILSLPEECSARTKLLGTLKKNKMDIDRIDQSGPDSLSLKE